MNKVVQVVRGEKVEEERVDEEDHALVGRFYCARFGRVGARDGKKGQPAMQEATGKKINR
jgi:hypothetical protein